MRLLHLADLHLGKCLLETPLLEEQRDFLRQAVAYAAGNGVDAVLIAGDVYDRSVPPADAVEALDDFLHMLDEAEIPALMLPGNHDSAERLGFGSRILARNGIHIAGAYDGTVPRVVLSDEYGQVHFYLLGFLRPVAVRQALQTEVENTDAAVRAALAGLPADASVRTVLLAHQFVGACGTPPQTSESETLSVGGSDLVDASAFDAFDYVALGHLHRAQAVGRETVRYAGAPLSYSLSEAGQAKSFPVVDLGPKGDVSVTLVPVRPLRGLYRIRGTLEELLAAGREPDAPRDDYVCAVLTGEPVLDPAGRLRQVYPLLLHVEQEPPSVSAQDGLASPDAAPVSDAQLFSDFFESVAGHPLSEGQRTLVEQSLGRLRERSV